MTSLLTHPAFHILFGLSIKPRHGYELMQQIATDSGGKLALGPATLYKTLKELRDGSFIEEIPFQEDARRRCYRLTRKGWDRLADEMEYYKLINKTARERKI